MKKINIMFIIDCFCDPCGTEMHLTRLVTLLNKDIFNIMIVAFDSKESYLTRSIRDAGIPFIHLPVGRYYTYDAIKKAFILSKLIRDNNIDIVQTYHFKSDFYGAIIAYLSGVRHIISSKRDIASRKSKSHFLLGSMTSFLFNGFIAVADAVGEVVSQKEKVSRDRITTIYNGVDIEKFCVPDEKTVAEARNNIGLDPEDFIVGIVAALRPEKNHPVFFDAIKEAKKEIKGIKALVVGGGVLLEEYKNYCGRIGISQEVVFSGWTDNVLQYLKTFDVACLIPSDNEGLSNSIIEKMAMGLPLIVTDVGGNAEAVIDGYNGFVVPKDNPKDLSDSIVKLFKDPVKRKEMGARSRQRILDLFTLEKMVKNHEKYYLKLMQG